MKCDVEEIDACNRKLKIEIPLGDYQSKIKAYYQKLLAKGKMPMQALVAVMRKLLHAIFGMFRHDTDFEGNRFLAENA